MSKARYTPLKDDLCYLDMPDGILEFLGDKALIILLQAEECFFGSMWHPDKDIWKDPSAYLGIGVFVSCNDLFYWASGDAETLREDEVEDLYRHYLANNKWGTWIWCCKHRKMQPQDPVKKDMITDGVWTDELEALPLPK